MTTRSSTPPSERTGGKRKASKVEYAETAPSPSRARISIKQEPTEVNDRHLPTDDRNYVDPAGSSSQLRHRSHDIGKAEAQLDEGWGRATNGMENGDSDFAVDLNMKRARMGLKKRVRKRARTGMRKRAKTRVRTGAKTQRSPLQKEAMHSNLNLRTQ